MENKTTCQQGSQEWLSLRKGRITASKLPIIMGLSPYQTPLQLWNEELGFTPPQESKPHMQRGLDIEDEIRSFAVEYNQGCPIEPAVVFHPDNPKFMASLDGLSDTKSFIIEIKNNNKEYHEMARRGHPVEFHIAQMQWQMYCANVSQCQYISCNGNEKIVVVVLRDDEFIEQEKISALEFLRMIDDLEEPPLTDRDYKDVSSNEFLQHLVNQYRKTQSLAKYYTDLTESTRQQIVSMASEKNVCGRDWKMTKSNRKGIIDYEKLCRELNVSDDEMEKYRKPSSISYRISFK